ncbi:restriction endonuclease subunit S [Patescibacteria group bacterium]|nr:restriction endonuclease subunit S [Patescibacteria group bacterium]
MQNSKTEQQNRPNDVWVTNPLPDVAQIIMGQSPPSSSYNKKGNGLPFFQGNKDFGIKYPKVTVYTNEPKKIAEKGDVLVSVRAPIGDVNMAAEKCCIGRGLASLRPNNRIDSIFLFYFAQVVKPLLEEKGQGSTFTGISKRAFEELEISYPEDIALQHIVAEKLENDINKISLSLKGIKKAKKLVQKFRQAIISAAITGRLTEEWREKNQQESTKKVVDDLKARRLSKATSTEKKKIETIYSYEEENNIADLPDEWELVALDKLCEGFQYGTSAKSNPEGKIPVLRMGNLQNGEIDWESLVYTSDPDEIEKYKLKTGNVLFNRTNSPELVGKTSIYRGEHEAIFAGYLIKINNFPELNSEYLNYCLNSQYARDFCYQVKTDGVSQSNINAQKLGKFEVPFCSLAEQEEIVRQVKFYFDIANQVEKQIERAELKVAKLTQAVLSKTFSSEQL